MKNRVNLYQQQFRPVVVLLNLNAAVFVWLLALLSVVVLGAYVKQQEAHWELEANTLNQQMSAQRSLAKTLSEEYAQRQADPVLVKKLERLQSVLNTKRAIVDDLKLREGQKHAGYSQLMLELARQHQPGVWLTAIAIEDESLRIEGSANESGDIPRWVDALSGAEYFSGKAFSAARIKREQQQLNFVLDSNVQDLRIHEGDEPGE